MVNNLIYNKLNRVNRQNLLVKMRGFPLIFIIALVCSSAHVQAQDDWGNDGEIEDVEIEIVKDRDITLPRVNRNFEKIAPINTGDRNENLEYFFNTMNFKIPTLDLKLRPLRIKDQPLNKLYGNYVKAGYGNYVTPYLEAFVNSKRNEQYAYGAHFNYLNSKKGPVDDKNSGSGRMDLDLFGKAFGKKATLSGNVGYHRNNYHFYGYEPNVEVDEDSIKQIFNRVNVSTSLQNTDASDPLQYHLGMAYDYITDDYKAKEGEVTVTFGGNYTLSEDAYVQLKGDYHAIHQQDEFIDTNRNLFRLKPLVGFKVAGFDITAGFNAVYEDDTLGTSDDLHFYPLAEASYRLSSVLEAYAGIRGNVEKQTLRQLVGSNPFLQSNQPVYHNNKTFDFYGGLRGKVASNVSYHAGLSLANYKNLHFFINDPTEQSKFVLAYDTDNVALLNIFGELTINTEKLRTTVRGDYWGYGEVDNSLGGEAWHRPNYELSLVSTYNLYDKLLLTADFNTMGGIKAIDLNTNEEISLDAALDLSLKADYLISNQVSAFISFNNIFSQDYQLLYRYPVRKLQFMAGVSYSF